ncbi:MAG TPA: hypothetical protein VGA09_03365, partial [Candidatus Binatia bacterium]
MKKTGRCQLFNYRICKLFFPVTLSFVLWACSGTEDKPAPLFTPPDALNASGDLVSARSPSAMEALSRGVAAVTPPGAALKDVYYEFDST